MSSLVYNGVPTEVDDLSLAYIHAVSDRLFSEGKGFYLGFFGTSDNGDPIRLFFWMHPSVPAEFRYNSNETLQLNGDLFESHLENASSPGGMSIGDGEFPYSFKEFERLAAF